MKRSLSLFTCTNSWTCNEWNDRFLTAARKKRTKRKQDLLAAMVKRRKKTEEHPFRKSCAYDEKPLGIFTVIGSCFSSLALSSPIHQKKYRYASVEWTKERNVISFRSTMCNIRNGEEEEVLCAVCAVPSSSSYSFLRWRISINSPFGIYAVWW